MTWNEALLDGPIISYEFLGLLDDDDKPISEAELIRLNKRGRPKFGNKRAIYNINIASQIMTPSLEPFVVQPTNIKRVFAGDDPAGRSSTVCLVFKNEVEARKNLGQWWIEPEKDKDAKPANKPVKP